jgi:penicillin G amidase
VKVRALKIKSTSARRRHSGARYGTFGATLVILICGVRSTALAGGEQWQQEAAARVAVIRGDLKVAGLHHAVRVQRDFWGVAHIYARDQHDLFFAQGFVVAQDRLFQMELWKRSGQGRLAEILGPSAVERDVNARRLKYRGDLAAEYRSYGSDALQILQSFTAGINAYIAEVQKPGGPGLPVEFAIANFRPEPWQPADCLNRLAAYSMMGNASSELRHAQLVAALGASRASQLLPLDPRIELDPAPGSDFSGLSPALLANIVSSDRRIPFPASSLQESNNWTVSGALTATGKPLLANDPHRVIAQPSLRYIVHLNAPGWNVIGAGEPGLPGVAAGHNERIAWGFTIFGLDQEDLYLEALNPRDPRLYKTRDGWVPLREEHETIRVRGAPDVPVVVHFTNHGPVLWDDGKRALALRWVGTEPGTAGYLGSLALDRAQNWREFERAMPHWKVPSENIVYADRDGNIGEHSTGLAPLRRNFSGLLPLPANGGFEWTGFVPNAELPHSYNPIAGYIATANQKMIPDAYPYTVGFEWAAPTRFDRIREVLDEAKAAGRKLTVADMEALQTDVVSLLARRLQLLLRHAMDSGGTPGELAASAANLLLSWDCALRTDSPAAALYELWAAQLRKEVTRRALPDSARDLLETWPLHQVVAELSQPGAAVFGADPAVTRDAILRDTLRVAYGELSKQQGPDPRQWSWGMLHKANLRHALDTAPDLKGLLDRGPVERSGDGDVVQSTAFGDTSFEQISGASYREIFDLSDWDNAVAINVPGQSGQPASKHFDDLLPLWSAGNYFPLKFSRAAVDEVTTDILTLHP